MVRNGNRKPGSVALLWFTALLTVLPHLSSAVDRPVTIGLDQSATNAVVMIAEERGFLPSGTALRYFPTGKLAMEAMFSGAVDLALATDTPIALAGLERNDFRVIATVGSSTNEHRIVARRDRGIAAPADLRGKRVATQKASAVHFFLDMFLAKNGLSEKNVKVVFMKPDDLVPALSRGEVDAISMREPYTSLAEASLKGNAVLFNAPGIHRKTYNLITPKKFLETRRETVAGVVAALIRGEDFLRRDPGQSLRIVASRAGISMTDLALQWKDPPVSEVSLDQSLLRTLENQARWAIRNRLVPTSVEFPNYLTIIDPGVLESVDPKRVSITR